MHTTSLSELLDTFLVDVFDLCFVKLYSTSGFLNNLFCSSSYCKATMIGYRIGSMEIKIDLSLMIVEYRCSMNDLLTHTEEGQ